MWFMAEYMQTAAKIEFQQISLQPAVQTCDRVTHREQEEKGKSEIHLICTEEE